MGANLAMSVDTKYTCPTVLSVHVWMPAKLFSLRTTRDSGYAFAPGQFARLGLPADGGSKIGSILWRAYSMVSAPHETDALEFYSIVVPAGEFSPRLAALRPGDTLYVDKTPFGFLTLDRFVNGEDLWLMATGTGLSAFLSMLRDPAIRRCYKRVFLVHGVREACELAYRAEIEHSSRAWAQEPGAAQLVYVPVATREALPGAPQARLTTLLADGRLEAVAGRLLDAQRSRIMLCGNPAMLMDARRLLAERGFAPGRRGIPGNLAVDNYW